MHSVWPDRVQLSASSAGRHGVYVPAVRARVSVRTRVRFGLGSGLGLGLG